MKYCILAAGKGSRVSNVIEGLHKALLPLGNTPAISKVIDSRPPGVNHIVVALGHLKDQVRSFLLEVYSKELIFTFVEVENYDGPGSGPGLSLLACEKELQESFIFTSVDTIPGDQYKILHYDWIGVCPITGLHKGTYFFPSNSPSCKSAFIGVAGIYDYKKFFQHLRESQNDKSTEVTPAIEAMKPRHVPFTHWIDIGDEQSLKKVCEETPSLVIPKHDQALFSVNGKIIKFWSNPNDASDFFTRAAFIPTAPKVNPINSNMCSYDYVEGMTLGEVESPQLFLQTLATYFRPARRTYLPLSDLTEIYEEKTNKRLNQLIDIQCNKFSAYPVSINDTTCMSLSQIMNNIDWDQYYRKSIAYPFHGDMQPENIIVTREAQRSLTGGLRPSHTMLIDWRSKFGDNLELGDIYYDLGKMLHGLIISGNIIKDRDYSIRVTHDQFVWIKYGMKSNLVRFIQLLKDFCELNKFDFNHVREISALHFLNIAPLYKDLHDGEYTSFLTLLGRLEFSLAQKAKQHGSK